MPVDGWIQRGRLKKLPDNDGAYPDQKTYIELWQFSCGF